MANETKKKTHRDPHTHNRMKLALRMLAQLFGQTYEHPLIWIAMATDEEWATLAKAAGAKEAGYDPSSELRTIVFDLARIKEGQSIDEDQPIELSRAS